MVDDGRAAMDSKSLYKVITELWALRGRE